MLQPQGLAGTIQEATQAHETMNRCMSSLERLLRDLSIAMNRHHSRATALLAQASARPEPRLLTELQQLQAAFNAQYLQLSSQMQHESRNYTALSNIMKTKHDTVKNAINNVR
jgi:hypothetical protein